MVPLSPSRELQFHLISAIYTKRSGERKDSILIKKGKKEGKDDMIFLVDQNPADAKFNYW